MSGPAPTAGRKRPREEGLKPRAVRKAEKEARKEAAGKPTSKRSSSYASRGKRGDSEGRGKSRPRPATADGAGDTPTPAAGGKAPGVKRKAPGRSSASLHKARLGKKVTKEDAKRLHVERKSAKPYVSATDAAVKHWNELRERATPKERKAVLVDEIIKLIRGKVVEVAGRHDVSRVVQGVIKHGGLAQREYVCKELFGHILEFTKSKHGHQLVIKMLRYGSPAVRAAVHKECKGHVTRLMTHNYGALVVDAGVQRAWTAAQIWDLYQELYGAEYVNFKAPAGIPRTFAAVLAARGADDKKKRAALEHMFYVLSKAADKNLLAVTFVQKLLFEFLTNAAPEQIVAATALVRDQVLALVSTREGAAAAALCFAYGTPKDRKLLFKALKNHVLRVALHDYGHMTLIVAMHVTDDTRTSVDAILPELKPHIPFLACHRYGRKVLLHLCSPRLAAYLAAADMPLLEPVTLPAYLATRKTVEAAVAPPPAAAPAADATKAGEAGTPEVPLTAEAAVRIAFPAPPAAELLADPVKSAPTRTSKKSHDVRSRELLTAFAKDIESALLTHTALLARDKHGAAVLYEAAVALGRLHGTSSESYRGVLAAVASLLTAEPSSDEVYEQRKAMHAAVATALQGGIDSAAVAAAHAGGSEDPSVREIEDLFKGRKKAKKVPGADADDDVDMPDAAEAAGDDDGEEDEDEEEDEDDDAAGGEANVPMEDVEEDAAAATLPLLEHMPSHLLLKWLLLREVRHAAAEVVGPAKYATVTPLPEDQPAVFGPLLATTLKGKLSTLATSNRAMFTLVDLLASRDGTTAAAVRKELQAHAAELSAQPDSAGKKHLLLALAGASAAPAVASVSSAKKAAAPATAPVSGKKGADAAAPPKSAGKPVAAAGAPRGRKSVA